MTSLEYHFKNREPFFVQENPRGVWHVESPDDPERMLCNLLIPIDLTTLKISKRWGTKPCLWCYKILDQATDGRFSR